MAIKTYRPTTQTLRYRTTLVNDDITTNKPHKPLLEPKQRTGGRRNSGDTTSGFIGGGHKRKLRIIDFKRDKTGIPATVASIEYDPNRSARIALLSYADGEKRYILQPDGLKVGQKIVSGPDADILVGNALPLRNIPPGTTIHNIELKSGQGRADGALGGRRGAVGGERRRLRAGEAAFGRDPQSAAGLHGDDRAGRQHSITKTSPSAKRDASRWLGKRPHNRGVSMNPVDHPHGGGEGKTSGGRHPVTPWGQPTRGYKTRNNKRTDAFIVGPQEEGRAIEPSW